MDDKRSSNIKLSNEQELFINHAKQGNNILVDACIGSGKTTAIQNLCNVLPKNYRILYLTYNKLLKLDAQSKIKNNNANVTNYHGFASPILRLMGVQCGVGELIQELLKRKPKIQGYDVLILDEYQDIDKEISNLLVYIRSRNPKMQIIAVGDMEQKIYDKTTLNVPEFMEKFLGNHIKLEFTKCFRLSDKLASKLGRIWNKTIIGVNKNCKVEEMAINQVVKFLASQNPKDILCLGANYGDRTNVLNTLEKQYPKIFNKKTVYSNIQDGDSLGTTKPTPTSAIFTTFDRSKGLERNICVVFDYTESYWQNRIFKPQQSFKILRNIFCVAASRGKQRIIFANNKEALLSEETLSTEVTNGIRFEPVINMSAMFDFKYREDIENCYSLLEMSPLLSSNDISEISISSRDELIDLSPCIGIYQEAAFFTKYDIEKAINFQISVNKSQKFLYSEKDKQLPLDNKILFLTSLETRQNRYIHQVNTPFVSSSSKKALIERLGNCFSVDESVQNSCGFSFLDKENGNVLFTASGVADVVKNNVVYELKFVSELSHEHFLQCACYIIALGLEKGILWNTRNNLKYEIRIPDKVSFLDAVAKTITKGFLDLNNCHALVDNTGELFYKDQI